MAALLFPVFAQVRAQARQTTCVSNLRQLGLAIHLYAQEYDDTLPLVNYSGFVAGTSRSYPWQYLINPYVRGNFPERTDLAVNRRLSIYVCPEYGKTGDGTTADQPSNSYGCNFNLMAGALTPLVEGRAPISRLAALQVHASLVLLGPTSGYCSGMSGNDSNRGYTQEVPTCSRAYVVARMRHSDGANYLHVDGHVKWYRAPTPYDAVSTSGVVWRRSMNPNASAWFRED